MKRLNILPNEEPEPETRECPECLSEIPVAAHKCAYCTSVVTPAA
jgi:large conductance mechanosensitive channel